MTITSASFRQIKPEFANETTYPDAAISFALAEAAQRLLPSVWGGLLDTGTVYFVAHRMALSSPVTAGIGGKPATTALAPSPGIVTGKSVGPVSKSMDVSMGSIDGAGEWNTTIYGRQFFGLAASVTVGAMQF